MNDSQTLLNVGVSEMGCSLSSEGVGTTLGRGTTTARFHCWGTVPDDWDGFRMSQAGTLSSKANSFKTLFGMLSGPGAVCAFTRESSVHICDLQHAEQVLGLEDTLEGCSCQGQATRNRWRQSEH